MGFFSSRLRRKLRRTATASLLTLGLAGVALGNPSGATVRHGQVNISPGTHAQIQQLTDQAIVDWQSFSIGPSESVRILQPGALSVLLNRVTGVDPSTILGSLEANGNVWLINPNGILFGPGSTVNVGGLVASTLDISNQDFLSGNYNFRLAGPELGAVVNQGRIRITDGGYAVLTGPSVLNEGTIVAKSGTVVLAAGEQATLNFDGRDLVSFAVGQSAGNGTVLLAPGMMSDTLAETFGVSTALRADQLVRDADGSVRLVNSSGTLIQAGEVSVDGQAGQDAGNIVLHSADVTVLADGSITSASGQGAESNGGDIYVLSYMDASASDRGFTDIGAGSSLLATGGTSGDGGFIEVSGDRLNLHGEIDLSATDGKSGDFLLDPVVVTIVNGNQMPTDTTDPIQLTTTTTIGDDWLESLNLTNLTIESAGDIIFDIDPIDGILDFRGGGRVDNLVLTAGTGELGNIFLGDDGTSILGLTNLTLNTVDAGGGDINLGDATVVLSGALDINSSGNINLQTSVLNLSSNSSRGVAPLSISAAGNLNLGSADIDVFNNFAGDEDLLIEAGGNIDLGTADLTYDVATQLDLVTTTIRAGGNITSSGGNVIDVAGATLIEGDSVSLAGANITVDNGGNRNSRLTVNAGTGPLDLSDGTLVVTGSTTLTSAGTMDLSSTSLTGTNGNLRADVLIDSEDDLNMADTRITTQGSLQIDGEADVTFGPSTVLNLGFNASKGSTPLTISAAGNLDLANADIDVFNNFAGDEDLLIEAGGNLDLGTADLTYDVATQLDLVTTTIRAGGNITSSGGNVIDVAGATLIEGDSVSLAGANITVDNGGNRNSRLTVNAGTGPLDLSDGTLVVTGSTTLTSAGTMDLSSTSLTGTNGNLRADVLIDSEDDLNMADTRITTQGSLQIDGEADVTFGPSTVLNLGFNASKGSTPLTISAAGNLDLANADIDVFNNFAGDESLLIEAGGLLDLGTSDLTYSVATQIDVVTTTIRGGGGITSESNPNPAANSFNNVFNTVGATVFEAGTGDLQLFDTRISVDQTGATSSTLNLTAEQGEIVLGESFLSTQSNIGFLADTLNAGSAQVATPNRVTLAINSGIEANDSQFDAGDIEIFGSTSGVLDPSKAVAGNVRLDLSQSGNTDISVLAEGNVEINHTGTGSVTLERAGLEGPPTGPASTSIASLTGDVFITSGGTVFIGSAGDTSPNELVNGAGTVRIDANTITDRHTGGIDVVAGETLELITDSSLATSANPLEVQAPGLLLDLSRTANNQGYVNVSGNVEFLQVIGRSSNIRVTEQASGTSLTALRDGTGTSSLNLGSTTFENIDYVDLNTIRLDTLNVGPTQSVSIQSVNGDIVDDSAGDNAILEGGLLLSAENGSIGTSAAPISINGGILAAEAGNDIFIQGTGDDLTIGQVEVRNTTINTSVASGDGIVAGGDVQIVMPGMAQTLLNQQADITAGGGIAIVLENGDFQQTAGTVRADNVALQIGRDAGQFDGTDVLSEISVEADNLVVDVTGDAILTQTNGDLTLTDQLTIGGETYSTTGAGGDLRVRVADGDLNIDTDLVVGEQAALLTGSNDVVGQGNLPNSINLNGSVSAGQSLVLISQGDINHTSGTLSAPAIGLGANGIIGTAANPVQLATNTLAVNPFEAQVNDPDGFTTVSSVSAVGATVNQGVPQPPEPPTPEPPTPEPEVPITPGEIPPSAFQEPQDFIFEEDLVQSEIFSQNQTALVEELLDMLLDPDYIEVEEVDPTRIPVIDDEDFLQKKFRR